VTDFCATSDFAGVIAMKKKRLAVLVIHGMGSQYKGLNPDPKVPTYSAEMLNKVSSQYGLQDFDADIGWFEVYWAEVLQPRQQHYAKALEENDMLGAVRQFVLYNLSDAASYFPSRDRDSSYSRIHRQVRDTIKAAADAVEPDAPIVVLAHSLGGHIMSNYIYDLVKTRRNGDGGPYTSAFRNLETFRTMFTFGCNIPVFLLSAGEPLPISYPGRRDDPRGRSWWVNFYDKDDPLGFPLRFISGEYWNIHDAGQLNDREINSGSFPTSVTPWSHNAYWKDNDVCAAIAAELARLVKPNR
jgi:hypothetical protein